MILLVLTKKTPIFDMKTLQNSQHLLLDSVNSNSTCFIDRFLLTTGGGQLDWSVYWDDKVSFNLGQTHDNKDDLHGVECIAFIEFSNLLRALQDIDFSGILTRFIRLDQTDDVI